MEKRTIARLDREVSVVGLGTWQLGADWGDVSADAANAVLEAALEHGVTFFDTADVYGDGRSERFCAELHAASPRRVRGHQDGPARRAADRELQRARSS